MNLYIDGELVTSESYNNYMIVGIKAFPVNLKFGFHELEIKGHDPLHNFSYKHTVFVGIPLIKWINIELQDLEPMGDFSFFTSASWIPQLLN